MAWALDREWDSIVVDGQRRHITEQNYELMRMLVDSQGELVRYAEIGAALGLAGSSPKHQHRAIHRHIRLLRRIVGEDEIVTVRDHGYSLRPAFGTRCDACGREYAS